ncbi:MAG: hypothetical protein ABFQ82_05580, partial [Thermodesulfobacteriota bacterium]
DTFLPLSAFATTTLLYHFLERILQPSSGEVRVCSPRIIVPWFISVVAVSGLLWVWPVGKVYGSSLLESDILWQGFWPVALGCGLMVFSRRIRGGEKFFVLPAGDILWLVYGWGSVFAKLWRRRGEGLRLIGRKADSWHPVYTRNIFDRGRQVEKKLMRWVVVGLGYLLFCFVLLFLSFKG